MLVGAITLAALGLCVIETGSGIECIVGIGGVGGTGRVGRVGGVGGLGATGGRICLRECLFIFLGRSYL